MIISVNAKGMANFLSSFSLELFSFFNFFSFSSLSAFPAFSAFQPFQLFQLIGSTFSRFRFSLYHSHCIFAGNAIFLVNWIANQTGQTVQLSHVCFLQFSRYSIFNTTGPDWLFAVFRTCECLNIFVTVYLDWGSKHSASGLHSQH